MKQASITIYIQYRVECILCYMLNKQGKSEEEKSKFHFPFGNFNSIIFMSF